MRRFGRTALLAAATAIVLAGTGCSGTDDATETNLQHGSAAPLLAATTRHMHVDFDPLTSPADAVDKADLVVTGTVVDIVDGVAYTFADPSMDGAAGHFTTYVVAVDKVLAGTGARAGDQVYASIRSSVDVSTRELAALNPRPRAVLILEDITTWKPHSAAKVARPAAIPADAPLFAPFPDGLWLQGPRDTRMGSVHAEQDELAATFGHPRTVDQLAATLATAAKNASSAVTPSRAPSATDWARPAVANA